MPISSSLAVLEFFPRLRYLTLVKQRYIRLRTKVLRDDNDGGGKKEELFINEKNFPFSFEWARRARTKKTFLKSPCFYPSTCCCSDSAIYKLQRFAKAFETEPTYSGDLFHQAYPPLVEPSHHSRD